MTNLQALLSLEKECAKTIELLIIELCDLIRESRMEELSDDNKVSAETWRKYGSMKNPNEFFLPEEQAKIVGNFMKNSRNALDFENRLIAIYHTKEISDCDGVRMLNPSTLKTLKKFADNQGVNMNAAWHDPR